MVLNRNGEVLEVIGTNEDGQLVEGLKQKTKKSSCRQ